MSRLVAASSSQRQQRRAVSFEYLSSICSKSVSTVAVFQCPRPRDAAKIRNDFSIHVDRRNVHFHWPLSVGDCCRVVVVLFSAVGRRRRFGKKLIDSRVNQNRIEWQSNEPRCRCTASRLAADTYRPGNNYLPKRFEKKKKNETERERERERERGSTRWGRQKIIE